MTISVCVAGATGWAGRAVAEAVFGADDLRLASAVSRSAAGQDLGEAWSGQPVGVPVFADVGEALEDVDVLVDYTSHDVVFANTIAAVQRGVAVVIGSSGFDAAQFATIDTNARAGGLGVVAERLSEVRSPALDVPIADTSGALDARGTTIGATQVHSVRLPSFTVSTEVIFAMPGERLSLRHDAGSDADPYVRGTLLAIRAVTGRVGLTRGLDALLLADG